MMCCRLAVTVITEKRAGATHVTSGVAHLRYNIFRGEKRSGGGPPGVRHVDDGQGYADSSCLARALLDRVHKDRAVTHNNGIAKELEFLTVEAHPVFRGEA